MRHIIFPFVIRFMRFFLQIFAYSWFFISPTFAQSHILYGLVRDVTSLELLAAANIRIEGTTRGTITNAEGLYRLSLSAGRYTIIFSFIGYKSDTIDIHLDRDYRKDIFLHPIPIQLEEVVVTDEDPAYAIMRKVIEQKQRWKEALSSYQLEAFTRQIMRRDTSIASISESYTTGFWQRGDTLREIIKQKRQTENIPMSQNYAAVGGIANFYDDEIRFSGYTFIGPTAKSAFEYYQFRLEQTREREGIPVYTIRIIPTSRITPLFSGTLTVIGDVYALIGVDVTPNEVYGFPFVSDVKVQYAQQFSLYEDFYWMPVDIRVSGKFQIGIGGLKFPAIGFEQVSSIYEYRINAEIPDTMRLKPRRTVAAEAEKYDSLFWSEREVLPLTEEEKMAYTTLDSTQTITKQFAPSGPLMALSLPSGSFLNYFDFRFNRVEGLFLGLDVSVDKPFRWLKTTVSTGYGLSDKKMKYRLGAEVFADSIRKYSLGAEYYHRFSHFHEEGVFISLVMAASSLFYKNDLADYYYANGWKLWASMKPHSQVWLRLNYRQEEHQSAPRNTDYSFFYRKRHYRSNPLVEEGKWRGLVLELRFGNEPIPLNIMYQDYLEVEIENTSRDIFGSDFAYTRAMVRGELHVPTFLKRNLFPPIMSLRWAFGLSGGELPPQRMYSLESRSRGLGTSGFLHGIRPKEFAGEQFMMLKVEQNFRSIPFLLLNIPFLYKDFIELIVHGSVARAWSRAARNNTYAKPTDGWYSEAGIGISRILGLFRIDVTRRFFLPSGYYYSISLARLM